MARTFILHALGIIALASFLSGCASAGRANSVASMLQPGNPIILFPQSYDRRVNTILSSNANVQQAGIDGRVLTITQSSVPQTIDQVTIDSAGDVGIRGSYNAIAELAVTDATVPTQTTALDLVRQWPIAVYRLAGDPVTAPVHVGILVKSQNQSGAVTRSFNLNQTILVDRAAIEQLDREVEQLKAEIKALKSRP